MHFPSVYARAGKLTPIELFYGGHVSDYQPTSNCDLDSDMAPVPEPREAQNTQPDLPELDFSRLRMARASLDAAFPQD